MTATSSRTSTVATSPEAVWEVLADFGALARWVPEVDHSCLLRSGPAGVGTTRRVQVGRTTVLEAITAWSPPEHLGYAITGLPPALQTVRNDWRLRPVADGTEVTVTTSVDAGPRPPQRLVAHLVARRLSTTSGQMLAGLTATLTSGDHARA
ncbi:MAG TPA: SRPBCC family protein [Acidimicrobiales bacterium]|nr:SRPBCC family protein [Acidimicrobiales bacterium]